MASARYLSGTSTSVCSAPFFTAIVCELKPSLTFLHKHRQVCCDSGLPFSLDALSGYSFDVTAGIRMRTDGCAGSDNSSGAILLSSTPGITVVVGFPFTASPESPCASEACSFVLAVNGRTSTAPSRPERGSLAPFRKARILPWLGNLSSIVRPIIGIGVTPLISQDRCSYDDSLSSKG